jgi:hypothetical protein
MCSLFFPQWHSIAMSIESALFAPFIITTMGQLSHGDPVAWRLWKRTCTSLVFLQASFLSDLHVCDGPWWVAMSFHAVFSHIGIALLFGHVGYTALHLAARPAKSQRQPKAD